MADKAITRRLKIFVNGAEVDATLTNLRKNLAKFRTLASREIEGTENFKKYNTEVAKLEVEYDQARAAQKTFRDDVKLTAKGVTDGEKALADFTGSFSTLLNGYRTGDILQIKEGFTGVKNGIKGATKAGLAFIATPIGAAIAALVAVGAAGKAWLDYNTQVVEALRVTQQITGLTDGAADNARIRAEQLAKTFDGDFQKNLETANALSKQFGITITEAFDVMEGQLVRGQDKNNEFFDSIDEYSVFFKKAGFSADDFGKIIATGYDLGFYKDKLPDAFKELDISLRNQTKGTRDALVDAFGAPFADDVLRRVNEGKTTVKEAFEEISAEAQTANLNQQQLGLLTSEIFRAAGEDIGGLEGLFDAYNQAIVENQRELTASEKITQDQITANTKLAAITSAIFSSGDEGFGLLIDKAKLFATETLISVLEAGVNVYNWFVDLNNESKTFSSVLTTIGIVAVAPFKTVGILIDNTIKAFGGLGDIIEGVFTLDAAKIAEGLVKGASAAVGVFDDLKAKALADAEEVKNAFSGGSTLSRKSLEDFTATNAQGKKQVNTIAPATPLGGDAAAGEDAESVQKEEEKQAAKEEKELERIRAQEEKKRALLFEIALENAESEEEKELLKAERDFEKQEQKLLDLKLSKEEEKQLLSVLEEQEQKAIEDIQGKYRTAKQKADEVAAAKEIAAKKALNNQILNASIDFVGRESKLGQGLLAIKGILAAKESLIQLGVLKNKVIVSSASAAADTGKGLAATASVGFPQNIPLLIGFAAQVGGIISSIKAAGKAKSLITAPSYMRGGDTGIGDLGLGENAGGKIRGVVEEDEYVVPRFVRRMPGVPKILDYLEAKRTGNTDSFAEGGDTIAPVNSSSSSDTMMVEFASALSKLNELLAKGFKITYTLNDEIDRRELAQKLDDTINESIGE